MNLIDILTSPWAIVPEKLLEIQSIYATHLRGEKIDLEAVEARLGRPLANDQQDYVVRENGVAVLTISGVIANKANLFTKVSGGASAQMLQKQVDSMAADPRVRAAVLDIDSPGGSVLGTPALAEAVKALAADKPTVAVSTGQMASAAYWIGSAAGNVYMSGITDIVGSIGVVATHTYNPRNAGAVTTEITAGKYKRIATDQAPLTKEGRAYLQAQVDHLYSVFVDAVAQNRGVSAEQVLERMADGRIFIGQQAIDAGLVDGVATVDQLVARLGDKPDDFMRRSRVSVMSAARVLLGAATAESVGDQPASSDDPVPVETTPKGNDMTPAEQAAAFAAEHPDAALLLRAEGAAGETARIKAVREQLIPGHEALIEKLAMDGKTTAAEAALAVNAAERQRVQAAADARRTDAPEPVKTDLSGTDPEPAAEAKDLPSPIPGFVVNGEAAALDAKARDYQSKNPGVSYLDAIKAVQKGA